MMKRSSLQTNQIVLYLLALGFFSLCVLAVAAYRGKVSTQISDDVGDAGRLGSYALLVFIAERDPNQSAEMQRSLGIMGKEIKRLLVRYPESSDELITVWKEFYTNAVSHQLNTKNTQEMVDASNRFLLEIRSRANEEARNGYLMLVYGALGLLLLLVRGFIMVRELHRVESNLRKSERRFAILAEASLDGIALSVDGVVEDANTQFSKLLGYEHSEVIGHHLIDFARDQDVDRSKQAIDKDQEITYEIVCVRKDKSTFPVEITARMLEFPERTMRLTVARDITARKQLEREWQEVNKSLAISNERWRSLATLDSLTGACTRRALHLTMIREIRRARHSGIPFSVMILDMDGFKQYNDCFGHVEGDEALRRVVEVLRRALRDVDVVARYGGDEFVVILEDTDALEANTVAQRCYKEVENETGFKCNMTASIGVLTCFIETESSTNNEYLQQIVEEILLRADKALYQSKTKVQEHITIADNLHINKTFKVTQSSKTPEFTESTEQEIAGELLGDVVV